MFEYATYLLLLFIENKKAFNVFIYSCLHTNILFNFIGYFIYLHFKFYTFWVSPLQTLYSTSPPHCFYEGDLPPTHPFQSHQPSFPLCWGIDPSQNQGLPLPLMPDMAILYYICSWSQSHGFVHEYSFVGGFVPGNFRGFCLVDIVVLSMGLQTPSISTVLSLTPPLGSLRSVRGLTARICICIGKALADSLKRQLYQAPVSKNFLASAIVIGFGDYPQWGSLWKNIPSVSALLFLSKFPLDRSYLGLKFFEEGGYSCHSTRALLKLWIWSLQVLISLRWVFQLMSSPWGPERLLFSWHLRVSVGYHQFPIPPLLQTSVQFLDILKDVLRIGDVAAQVF
jgi:hypothetical protein